MNTATEVNPVTEWIARNPSFGFAQAMKQALAQYGSLTVNQEAAVMRCIERDKQRAATPAPTVSVETALLEQAFAKAKDSKLKHPRIRLANFVFKPASATSRNPGSIYVTTPVEVIDDYGTKSEGVYLGKVFGGLFSASRDCTPAIQAEVASVMADPKGAAEQYGKLSGRCCICSRTLTDETSVERGIGPICAAKFGW